MKAKHILVISLLTLASAITLSLGHNQSATLKAIDNAPVAAESIPTVIDVSDTSESEIREYYSSLNNLDKSELQGTNLLKNLRTIIHSDLTYYTYADIWKIYEITDRDWDLSPLSEIETYDESTQTITNYEYGQSTKNKGTDPYVHPLYRVHDDSDGYIREWDDHNVTGINREHVWPQSYGFKADTATGPAGTDIHHLMAGDAYVNQQIHNAYSYGYVDTSSSYSKGNQTYTEDNLLGLSQTLGGSNKVFEPQDCDKGDIARACFYMVACYNNYSGNETISDYDPNLAMSNTSYTDSEVKSSYKSSSTNAITLGILQDLLEWNELDPVDDYEIHRNNLIYNNYQHNRNPFIDYPEWANYIWGYAYDGSYDSTPTGSANPSTDSVYGEYSDDDDTDYTNESEDYTETTETDTSSTSESTTDTSITTDEIIFISVGCGLILIILVIFIACGLNKKARKKAKKIVKKVIKKKK